MTTTNRTVADAPTLETTLAVIRLRFLGYTYEQIDAMVFGISADEGRQGRRAWATARDFSQVVEYYLPRPSDLD